jgi:hypothetical protein
LWILCLPRETYDDEKNEYFIISSYPEKQEKNQRVFFCLHQCKLIYHTKDYKESVCHLGFAALLTCYPKLAICA